MPLSAAIPKISLDASTTHLLGPPIFFPHVILSINPSFYYHLHFPTTFYSILSPPPVSLFHYVSFLKDEKFSTLLISPIYSLIPSIYLVKKEPSLGFVLRRQWILKKKKRRFPMTIFPLASMQRKRKESLLSTYTHE